MPGAVVLRETVAADRGAAHPADGQEFDVELGVRHGHRGVDGGAGQLLFVDDE